MKPEFWLKRWQDRWQIGFHQSEPEPLLTEFFPKAAPGSKVFVPLCGKSLDMVWLAQQGYQVVGVEPSALACFELFCRESAAAAGRA